MVEISNGSIGIVKHSGLSKMTIGAKVTIREALNALSNSGQKCLIIVNSNKQLLGTLSDGDLRKAILKGIKIDKPITKIYNKNSVYLTRNTFETTQAKNIFLKNKFDLIPIVDESNVVVDFVVWEEIFTQDEKVSNQLRNLSLSNPTRRQDAPKVYDMNASIYIWKRKALLENDTLYTDKTSLYVMPEKRSVDIDTELDWEFVEFITGRSSLT
jgi:CBS domain-containing protein